MCGNWGHPPRRQVAPPGLGGQVTVGLVPEEVMLDLLAIPPDVQGDELC